MEAKIEEEDPSGRYVRFAERLGAGSFKDVFKGMDQETGREIAWNAVNLTKMRPEEQARVEAETKILAKCQHKHIINFLAYWKNERNQVCFATEVLPAGTLRNYFLRIHPRLKVIKRWCRQILRALVYLHAQNPPIIHRDLKCDNIFINGPDSEVRVGDFGLSANDQQAQSVLGTPEFIAPEIYKERYTSKVDVYAFGMCVLEMVTREYPYAECKTPYHIWLKVAEGTPPLALSLVVSAEIRAFIELCLLPQEFRPSARDLLHHPFLTRASLLDHKRPELLGRVVKGKDTTTASELDSGVYNRTLLCPISDQTDPAIPEAVPEIQHGSTTSTQTESSCEEDPRKSNVPLVNASGLPVGQAADYGASTAGNGASTADSVPGSTASGTVVSADTALNLTAIAEIPSNVQTGEVAGDIKEDMPIPPPYVEPPPPYVEPIVRTDSKESPQTDAQISLPSSPKNTDGCVSELEVNVLSETEDRLNVSMHVGMMKTKEEKTVRLKLKFEYVFETDTAEKIAEEMCREELIMGKLAEQNIKKETFIELVSHHIKQAVCPAILRYKAKHETSDLSFPKSSSSQMIVSLRTVIGTSPPQVPSPQRPSSPTSKDGEDPKTSAEHRSPRSEQDPRTGQEPRGQDPRKDTLTVQEKANAAEKKRAETNNAAREAEERLMNQISFM